MSPGYAARLRHWAAGDAALQAKRRFMMALLQQLSGGQMDEAFFERLAESAERS